MAGHKLFAVTLMVVLLRPLPTRAVMVTVATDPPRTVTRADLGSLRSAIAAGAPYLLPAAALRAAASACRFLRSSSLSVGQSRAR